MLLAGGESLLRPGIFSAITCDFPQIVFPVFTNGMLIDEGFIAVCKKQRQLVPVISIEGSQADTDERRGDGVFARAAETMGQLDEAGIFCGISITVTRSNCSQVISAEFIERYLEKGCRLFIFVEYVPVEEGSDGLMLEEAQRRAMSKITDVLSSRYDALFIAFPGDEEKFGGCLAAGRGFVHVNHQGELEPCPFAPYSDSDLHAMPLQKGLASPLLRKIREHHRLLQGTNGGCALWEKREMVKDLTGHVESSVFSSMPESLKTEGKLF